MNAALGSTVPWEVPRPSLAPRDHLPIRLVETSATHALKASTASLLNLIEMNLWDTVSAQEGGTVLKEQVLIGVHAQQVPTVTGLACIVRSNVKTAMLENTAMGGTSHLQQISVHLAITAG